MSLRPLAIAVSFLAAVSATGQWQTTTNTSSGLWHSGPVGVGLTDPNYPFEVNGTIYQRGASGGVNAYSFVSRRSGGAAGYPDIYGNAGGLVLANVAAANTQLVLTQYAAYFLGTRLVGIGTSAPSHMLDVVNTSGEANLRVFADNPTYGAVLTMRAGNGSQKLAIIRYNSNDSTPAYWDVGIRGTNNNYQIFDGNAVAARLVVDGQGQVGIGTVTPTARLHVAGNVIATGSITGAQVINAVFQDLAEWVPATTDMTPGTVVVLNPARANEVMVSGRAYDTSVAGVVSAQPGILLGVAGETKEQIATTGRVRVRVDATKGAVKIGDLLVTSDKPGMAMRSEPMEINGRTFHQPGTIIGKALEDLAGGEGEILVLLSLQ